MYLRHLILSRLLTKTLRLNKNCHEDGSKKFIIPNLLYIVGLSIHKWFEQHCHLTSFPFFFRRVFFRMRTLTAEENIEAVKKIILNNRRITIREVADDVAIYDRLMPSNFYGCFRHETCGRNVRRLFQKLC